MEKGEIILYQPNETLKLEVRIEEDTVWLSIDEMALLFDRDKSVIGKHIRNIFKEGELFKDAVWAKFAYTASDNKIYQVDYYNLDVIISVGYRVKSKQGTRFRQWATQVLKEYLLKGYSINRRLQSLEQTVAEHSQKIDFFVRTALPPIEGIFYNGQIFDAYKFATDLIKSAKHSLVLIDNYVDETEVYHIGASLKDLGKKMFAFSKLNESADVVLQLLSIEKNTNH